MINGNKNEKDLSITMARRSSDLGLKLQGALSLISDVFYLG